MSEHSITSEDSQSNDKLSHALALVAKGFAVFPCYGVRDGACLCGKPDCASPGKHPMTPGGVHDATRDAAQVVQWFGRSHPDANVGVSIPDDVAVVDVDPRNGGNETRVALVSEHGEFPETLATATGGGGLHEFFRRDPSRKIPGKLGNGIDLLGKGRYVIGPGSLHQSGARYELLDLPIADLPEWCYARDATRALSATPAIATETTRYGARALEEECDRVRRAEPGEQEPTLNAAALKIGSLIAGGEILESEARAALLEAGLAMRTGDPSRPWTESQILAKITRGFRDGARTPRGSIPVTEFDAPTRPANDAAARAPEWRRQVAYDDKREDLAIDDAIDALADARSEIYQRGGLLVHVARDLAENACKGSVRRPPDSPRIATVQPARLRYELARLCDFEKPTTSGTARIAPPQKVVEGILKLDEWPKVRKLRGITEFPIVRRDGAIVATEGYDAETGVYVAPSCDVRIPDMSAREAAEWVLTELVSDFPFASEAHRSAWLAALLTPLARYAFEGPTPLILLDKNQPGTGGSLLADVIGMVCFGRECPRMAQQTDEYQEENRLLGVAVAGDPVILIDNVNRPLGNAALDKALTGTSIRGRWLGGNTMVTAPWNCLIMATGNNVELIGDTTRRTLPVRLESSCENPETREGFRHDPLLPWVREHRGEILGALLRILADHLRATDRPAMKPWGSYEGWSEVVRGAVVACGLPDPYAGRRDLVEADADKGTLAAVIDALVQAGATSECKALTTRELIDIASRPGDDTLDNVLRQLDDDLDAKRIAYQLRSLKGRVIGARKLQAKAGRGRYAAWFVVTV